jgi:uncharacterized membrane-anchored protein YjiN (DUF445 family)
MQRLVMRLKTDPAFLARGEAIRAQLQDDTLLTQYLYGLWEQLRSWLKQDLEASDSVLHARVAGMGAWIGKELAQHATARLAQRTHAGCGPRHGPRLAQFLTRHIGDTVKNWDPQDMSRQIELQIGKDLQYIRINGTIVGGAIGLLLFGSSQLIALLRAM